MPNQVQVMNKIKEYLINTWLDEEKARFLPPLWNLFNLFKSKSKNLIEEWDNRLAKRPVNAYPSIPYNISLFKPFRGNNFIRK